MKKWIFAGLVAAAAGCGKADPDAIVPYGRENNSGTYMYFKEHVLDNMDFAPNVQTLQGTGALINAVSKDKRAIGYGGIGYVKGVKTLKVKKDAGSPAIEPALDNVVKGTYPISRYLFFYTIGEPEGAAKHFIEWARGPEGQKVVEEVHYFPLPEKNRGAAPLGTPPAATLTLTGSDTMVILGQRWAERYRRKHPEVVLQVNGGGSGVGIAALIDGKTNICQASRPMKPKERDQVEAKHGKKPVESAMAMDGLAIFVHESNPRTEITLAELKAIYTGRSKSWKGLGIAP